MEEGETVPNSQLLAPTRTESVLKVRGVPKAYLLQSQKEIIIPQSVCRITPASSATEGTVEVNDCCGLFQPVC